MPYTNLKSEGEKKMKNKLNSLMVIAFLALISIGGTEGVFAQAQPNTPPPLADPDLKIINDKTLTVAGKLFPKMAPSYNKTSGQSCCSPGDSRNMTAVIDFKHYEQAAKKGKVTYEGTTPYSPPLSCWVISSYKLNDGSASGYSRNLTGVPSGYTFVTSSQYQQTYENLHEYVAKLNILNKFKIDLDAKLRTFTNNYSSYSQSMSASHGSVALYVKLEGKGIFNGRSWYEGTVDTTETCCPPEIHDPLALKKVLTDWVDETVNALPNKGKAIVINPRDTQLNNVQRMPAGNVTMTTNIQPEPSPTPR
jgi:hypothetical protein